MPRFVGLSFQTPASNLEAAFGSRRAAQVIRDEQVAALYDTTPEKLPEEEQQAAK